MELNEWQIVTRKGSNLDMQRATATRQKVNCGTGCDVKLNPCSAARNAAALYPIGNLTADSLLSFEMLC